MNKYKKLWLPALFLLMIVSLITACGGGNEAEKTDGTQDPQLASPQEEESNPTDDSKLPSSSFPVTIIDDTGEELTIEQAPESIVSIQASHTEIAFALGLADKIVGVSDYDNYPPEVEEITKVGGQNINVELVIALNPDLALVTDHHYASHPHVLDQFRDAGIDVIVVPEAHTISEVYDNIRLLGKATGSTEQAESIIQDMESRFDAIRTKAAAVAEPKRVWVEVAPAPRIYTTGKGTFMHEMLEMIHAENAASDHEGWVTLNEEEIIVLQPDVIITTYGFYMDHAVEDVLARVGWSEVPAIKNKQVFDVESDPVVRPGPRLADGVEQLAKAIYPEIFH